MLSRHWLVCDMDGTITPTPTKSGGEYLSLASSPCYGPLRRYVALGGNLCVVSTAGRRMWRQVFKELTDVLFSPTCSLSLAATAATGGGGLATTKTYAPGRLALCGFSGAALFLSDPATRTMQEVVPYRLTALKYNAARLYSTGEGEGRRDETTRTSTTSNTNSTSILSNHGTNLATSNPHHHTFTESTTIDVFNSDSILSIAVGCVRSVVNAAADEHLAAMVSRCYMYEKGDTATDNTNAAAADNACSSPSSSGGDPFSPSYVTPLVALLSGKYHGPYMALVRQRNTSLLSLGGGGGERSEPSCVGASNKAAATCEKRPREEEGSFEAGKESNEEGTSILFSPTDFAAAYEAFLDAEKEAQASVGVRAEEGLREQIDNNKDAAAARASSPSASSLLRQRRIAAFNDAHLSPLRLMTHGSIISKTRDALVDLQFIPNPDGSMPEGGSAAERLMRSAKDPSSSAEANAVAVATPEAEEKSAEGGAEKERAPPAPIAVQVTVMGVPMSRFDDFFPPSLVADLASYGVSAKKQPNSVAITKKGIDKALCVQWLRDHTEGFALERSLAFGDIPSSVDKPLTAFPPMQFVSLSTTPGTDPTDTKAKMVHVGDEEVGCAAFLEAMLDEVQLYDAQKGAASETEGSSTYFTEDNVQRWAEAARRAMASK